MWFPNKNKVFTKKELIDAYDYSRTNLNYSHILIGGGAVIDFKNEEIVLDLIRYIRNKEPQKGITLMSVPLPNINCVCIKKQELPTFLSI